MTERRRGTTPIIGAEGLTRAVAGLPAADRPVENSETWERAFSDEELSSMQEQGNWNHFEASLFKTCQRLRARSAPVENSELPTILRELHQLRAEIFRLRQERTEIAQEFEVSTDFDLGEHARVVMASQDDFKAELARLRADRLTDEETQELVSVLTEFESSEHHFAPLIAKLRQSL